MLATIPEDLVDLRARKIGFAGDVPATAQDIAGAIAAQALASHVRDVREPDAGDADMGRGSRADRRRAAISTATAACRLC